MAERRDHVALTNCYFCNEGNEILLATRYNHHGEPIQDMKKFHGKIINMNPCSKCQDYMKQGVILITIDSTKSDPDWNKPPKPNHCWDAGRKCFGDLRCQCNCTACHSNWMPNPYRTGGWFVVKDEAVMQMITPSELAQWAIKHRFVFIEHEAAERLGLFKMEAST